MNEFQCSICKRYVLGYGNNAWPINENRCCNECNNLVIAARLRILFNKKAPVKEPAK